MTNTLTNLTEIQALVERKALFVSNHSGGKDSQAMLIKLLEIVPRDQILVVHATLGDIEWPGALELAEKQAKDAGLPFIVASAVWEDGSPKTFENMVEKRFVDRPEVPSFPSSDQRYCTSDLKRGPIEREIRRYMKARGLKLIVNCIGERAAEGKERAKKNPFEFSKINSKAGREWHRWFPIFTFSTAEVFATIADAGQKPHPAYAGGNERLSCLFCIYGKDTDLAHAAREHPEVFARYVALEKKTGYTMHMTRRSLTDLVADAANTSLKMSVRDTLQARAGCPM